MFMKEAMLQNTVLYAKSVCWYRYLKEVQQLYRVTNLPVFRANVLTLFWRAIKYQLIHPLILLSTYPHKKLSLVLYGLKKKT